MAGTTNFYGISYPTSTDYVKDGATAMQTIATGFDSVVAIPTYNNQTGTSYTFVLADTGKTVTSNNASAVTFTIPPQSSVAWTADTTLTVRNYGAGVVTIAGGSGVTVTNATSTIAQYGSAKIVRTGSNAWTVLPDSGGESGLTKISTSTLSGSSGQVLTGLTAGSRYRILINMYGSVNNAMLQLRFREGSTDKTTDYYGGMSFTGPTSAAVYTQVNNDSRLFLGRYNSSADKPSFYSVDLWLNSNGNSARVNLQVMADAGLAAYGGFTNDSMATVDGVNIYPDSGTITGTITLYKYQD